MNLSPGDIVTFLNAGAMKQGVVKRLCGDGKIVWLVGGRWLHRESVVSVVPESARIKRRLDYLRREIELERVSYSEIAELQALSSHIPEGDVVLREWAGLPEGGTSRRRDFLWPIPVAAIFF